jgi:hypothetical protein
MSQLRIKKYKKNNNKDNQKLINKNKIKEKFKDFKKQIKLCKNKYKTKLKLFMKEIELLTQINEKSMN